MKLSRTARLLFRPLLDADGPVKLDVDRVGKSKAIGAIREVAMFGLARSSGAADPLDSTYVLVTGARSAFLPTRFDRFVDRVRRAGAWLRSIWRR